MMRFGPTLMTVSLAALWGCGDFIVFESEPSFVPQARDGGGTLAYAVAVQAYARLLDDFVEERDQVSVVDYERLSQDAAARRSLDAYLEAVAAATPQSGDLAFWLNAYHACLLRGVLQEFAGDTGYSVASGDFALLNATRLRREVAGNGMTLNELQHGVLRGQQDHEAVSDSPIRAHLLEAHQALWQGELPDARLHMALSCGARSCPNIRPRPYTASALDAQLSAAASAFLDDEERGAGPQGVSPIFRWYGVDFLRSSGSVERFIEVHRTQGLRAVDIDQTLPFDWSLHALP